ncbi:MAG TPA: inorganic diphosphatase [Polyangia bacterium]|jgi:inorganic pyrophosphatase|nr:inorganic diphosphatase [Polyangia bacterium]
MSNLLHLPPRTEAGAFHVVVESPRGSAAKLKYEPQLEAFTFSRPLVSGLAYPFEWGFVPGTMAPDGDPLDAAVLLDVPTYPGVVLACRALGVVKLTQRRKKGPGRERNDRVIAVPVKAPRADEIKDADHLPARVREEIEQFFLQVTLFEGKEVQIEGWEGPAAVEALIDSTAKAYRERQGR